MAAISLKNVSFSYKLGGRRVRVLRDFDLEIEQGDFVAIQGPSGSGKSTLLYLMSGFLAPDRGRISVSGVDILSLKGKALAHFRSRSIGFIFQQFHLLPKTSVLQNIRLASEYPSEVKTDKTQAQQRALEIAQRLGLTEHLEHAPNQLSGGQQQRVAIARALLNDPQIILADEPTGSLDSRTAAQTMNLLKEIHESGKTVVIITHDPEVAQQCDKVIHVKDGSIYKEERLRPLHKSQSKEIKSQTAVPGHFFSPGSDLFRILLNVIPLSVRNMWRNKTRSFLTMLGVIIGVASILAMVTFGEFVQQKILESYETMGVNKISVSGRRNWSLRASDVVSQRFDQFDHERDIQPLLRSFPQIKYLSPEFINWERNPVHFGGRSIENKSLVYGIDPSYLKISGREVILGNPMVPYHTNNASPVCVIGFSVAQELFRQVNPIHQLLTIENRNGSPYSCQVISVLERISANEGHRDPNYNIFLPHPYFRMVNAGWYSRYSRFVVQVAMGTPIEETTKAIEAYFDNKYGKAGRFRADSDSIMVQQLRQFLWLFKLLLAAIAGISLVVGGMGITNMMLASLSEQLKEVGIRKALGATDFSIRIQYLSESLILCLISGLIGLGLGFSLYQAIIYLASKVTDKITFQWVVEPWAIVTSLGAIVLVGIGSGLIPSLKAERLKVIEALRSE